MPIEQLDYENRDHWLALRRQDVTASGAAALLGVHPYQTAYGLAAEKLGKLPPVEETAAMRRGSRLEAVVIEEVALKRPDWRIEKSDVYFRDTEARLGATPDTVAFDADGRKGTVQIKTVAEPVFKSKWVVDGEVELPAWIAIQANIEAHLMGAEWAAVGILVVGFGWELHIIDVPLHDRLLARIKAEVALFWADIAAGKMPDPDYGRDGATIAKIYAEATPGASIDLSGDNLLPSILAEREVLKAQAKQIEERIKVIDAEVKEKMGDAETATLPGWVITNKTTFRKGYVVQPTSYRTLRPKNIAAKEAAE